MASSEQHLTDGLPFALRRIWPGALWLALACLAAAPVFYQGVEALVRTWGMPEFSHGPLIPVISGYLFLRELKAVPPNDGPVPDRWPGAAVMLLAMTLGLVGSIASFDEVVAYALIVWVGGVILTSFGWRRGKQFWPPVLHLAFMLPLPGILYYKTSLALQFVSSEIGVSIIRAAGVSVFLDGNIIDLDIYKLHVAEACSGLRYLFPVMSFTYIFAVLYQGSLWIKATLLLAAIPITVMLNAIRVGVIGIMVDRVGIEYAEGFTHIFEGWVIFGLSIAVMLGLAKLLQLMLGDRRTLLQALDIETRGITQQLLRVGDIRPSRALLGTSCVLALAGSLMMVVPALNLMPQSEPVRRDLFTLFPRQIGDWRSAFHEQLEPGTARGLGADDYLLTDFEAPGAAAPVSFFVAWYRDQSKGGVHSPEICIPGSGWEIAEIETAEIAIPVDNGTRTIPLNRAIIRKGLTRQLVYYWFDQRGRRLASDYAAKAYLLWDGVSTGQTDGALIRLVTPIADDESVSSAESRLQDLLAEAMPVLPDFIDTEWSAAP